MVIKTLIKGKKALDRTEKKIRKTKKRAKRGIRILLFLLGFVTGAGGALYLVYIYRDALAAAVRSETIAEKPKGHLLFKKNSGK